MSLAASIRDVLAVTALLYLTTGYYADYDVSHWSRGLWAVLGITVTFYWSVIFHAHAESERRRKKREAS